MNENKNTILMTEGSIAYGGAARFTLAFPDFVDSVCTASLSIH